MDAMHGSDKTPVSLRQACRDDTHSCLFARTITNLKVTDTLAFSTSAN